MIKSNFINTPFDYIDCFSVSDLTVDLTEPFSGSEVSLPESNTTYIHCSLSFFSSAISDIGTYL